MSSSPVDLRVDWCSYKAAKWAVEHWHYSRTMPKSKIVHVGAWENDQFVGAVLFNVSANNNIGKPYGLKMTEVCELVRVALTNHVSPVSQIVSRAIKMLKLQSPGLRLIVSFADPEHFHVGGIYQAMNWCYAGMTMPADEWIVNGKRWHGRALRHEKPAHLTTAQAAKAIDPDSKRILGSSKHRYLYPLDRAMRKQIAPLALPYPKRETSGPSVEGDTLPQAESDVRSIGAALNNNAKSTNG
jgi:hypothetical protein